jgi:hypothetical protein
MQFYKTFKAPAESCKLRDLWLTDFVFMPNNNKIALAYTSKELSRIVILSYESVPTPPLFSYLRYDIETGAQPILPNRRHGSYTFLFGLLVRLTKLTLRSWLIEEI